MQMIGKDTANGRAKGETLQKGKGKHRSPPILGGPKLRLNNGASLEIENAHICKHSNTERTIKQRPHPWKRLKWLFKKRNLKGGYGLTGIGSGTSKHQRGIHFKSTLGGKKRGGGERHGGASYDGKKERTNHHVIHQRGQGGGAQKQRTSVN